ncbi:GspH/FimT family pseudopilin [Marinospirillum celere]|uniref:GspH/FimT family pseudopilin n=1 Tax=Marinospirillum celere TaxID=1122252 RepID=UPI000B85A042|nr:hypothetical protein [Marinospirillum celere]
MDLLLVLAITGLLFGVALPSYQFNVERQQQTAELNRLRGVLQQARLIANLLGQEVFLCPAASSNNCSSAAISEDLLLLTSDGQPLRFYPGSGRVIAFPSHDLSFRPLPRRGAGGTLLPCTGFKYNQPKAITFSVTGRLRINSDPPASLQNLCPS